MSYKNYSNLTEEEVKFHAETAKFLEVDVEDYLEFENEVAGIDYLAPQKNLVY